MKGEMCSQVQFIEARQKLLAGIVENIENYLKAQA